VPKRRESCGRAVPAAVLTVVVGMCVVSGGCAGYRTLWSSESRSPDSKEVARAESIVTNEGLSIVTSIQTNVFLSSVPGSSGRMMILQLADATDAPEDTHVQMNWETPTHLVLTYTGNQAITFEAVKCGEVVISVRVPTVQPTSDGPDGIQRGKVAPPPPPGGSPSP